MNRHLVFPLVAILCIQASTVAEGAPPERPPDTRSDLDRALYDAIEKNDPSQVEAELKKGADANAAPIERVCLSPLATAIEWMRFSRRKKEADPEWAVKQTKVVELLLDHKADPNGPGQPPCTLMRLAINNGVPAIAALMIDHGVTLNPKKDLAPLNAAIAADRPEMVRLLIDKGADVNFTNDSSRKPLSMALNSKKYKAKNAEEIVKMLESAGAVDEPEKKS